MESYDVFLINNFVALPAFVRRYGIYDPSYDNPDTGHYLIAAKWQSSMQVSGQLGALIGVFIAGKQIHEALDLFEPKLLLDIV